MTENTDELTALEAVLRDGIATRVAAYAGRLAGVDGMPPDAAEARAAKLQAMIPAAATAMVRELRESLRRGMPEPTHEILDNALLQLADNLLAAVETSN